MQAEISTMFGLNVYTDKGIYIGKVNDVVLEVSERKVSGLAVSRLNPEMFDTLKTGVVIPYRWVTAVGDVVLIRHVKDQFKKQESVPDEYNMPEEEEQ
jgi:sporulation protein YlmC with PRC-barrel domain